MVAPGTSGPDSRNGPRQQREAWQWYGWTFPTITATIIAIAALAVSGANFELGVRTHERAEEDAKAIFARHILVDVNSAGPAKGGMRGLSEEVKNYSNAPVHVKIFGHAEFSSPDAPTDAYLEIMAPKCTKVRVTASGVKDFRALEPVLVDPLGYVWSGGANDDFFGADWPIHVRTLNGKKTENDDQPGEGPLYWHLRQGQFANALSSEIIYPKKVHAQVVAKTAINESACVAPGS